MPLTIRPYQPSDAQPLLARFSADARAPWLRLPHPYTVDRLLDPESGLKIWVAETQPGRPVGLLAFDMNRHDPLMIGPLVPDEQLADLYVRALLNHALDWARDEGIARVRVKVDVGEDRALAFFPNQGFQLLAEREYVLAARRGKPMLPQQIDGLRFGPSPEMLSSDYMRLYLEIGGPLGWTERTTWTRPQIFEHLQQPNVHLLSARAGDTYLGFAELQERTPGDAEILYLGLLPAFRGRKLGSVFLSHVLHHAFDTLQLERVWIGVHVADDEKSRLDFYTRQGFRQDRSMVFLGKELSVGKEARSST